MNYIPPPRKKRSGADSERVSFDEYLVEGVEEVDRDATKKEKEGREDGRREPTAETTDRQDDSYGEQGSLRSENGMPRVRRIDLRA